LLHDVFCDKLVEYSFSIEPEVFDILRIQTELGEGFGTCCLNLL
jgi:hypothetical protein